ncbi:phosphoenolpyruvate--protein phosphotransferase [Nocardia sp. CNY236]|uniref:phosphoenolpyruvate--protein phosphotransferase n=1 Tax=Nocardia sp. CNY236 TaxID=1169152 RepID=UPI000421A3D6|nr:putative PEP-binding protein [Nocardia sp. CNY236]
MTRPMPKSADISTLHGTPAVPGVVAAPTVRPAPRIRIDTDTEPVAVADRESEVHALHRAARSVAERLHDRATTSTGVAAEVLSANAAMAADRGWLGTAEDLIGTGMHAARALVAATDQFVDMFRTLGGSMAERATDLRDVCDRVLAELAGTPEPGIPTPERASILVSDDLAPADAAGLDPNLVVGLATSLGGPTSHTAIIARQLGIPCVVAVDGLDEIAAGMKVLLDGSTGRLLLNPDPETAARAVTAYCASVDRTTRWTGPGATADGHRVEVLVNVQDGAGARTARRVPAEGVGLFRTELCFLDRESEPTVEEQMTCYREVLDAYPEAKVIIRTLDAGSDKPLRFVGHSAEANPALGVRGYRIAARESGLLERQLDAVAAAAADNGHAPWVMAPMISTAAEAKAFADPVRARGLVPGVMIEVPAAALMAEAILEHVDFASIGTNDLAQYTMAADRMSPRLASFTDPWQPAVLDLVARTSAAGHRLGKPVGVCGEGAADPLLACVLAGFGITSLSAAATAIAAVGATLATVTIDDCRRAAAATLSTTDPRAARAVARSIIVGDASW